MVIDLGEPHILIGQKTEPGYDLVGIEPAFPVVIQQRAETCLVYGPPPFA